MDLISDEHFIFPAAFLYMRFNFEYRDTFQPPFFFCVHFFAKIRNRWADQTTLIASTDTLARIQVATTAILNLAFSQ